MNLTRLVFSFFFITILSVHADFSTRLVQVRTLDAILNPSKYDKRIRPNAVNESDPMDKPIVIYFNVFVRDIQEVDIESKTMRMQINLRYEWTDARLKYDDINGRITYLSVDNISRIWFPDIFFPNELSASKHSLITDNSLTRLYPDGRIYHASRYTLTLICSNMKLNRYPLDKQTCPLQIAPWAFMKSDVLFQFGVKEAKVGPIIMTKKQYSLPNYQLISTDTANCSSNFLQSRYACVEVLFTFQRILYRPMTQIFGPTTFLLILSWIPFFLHGSPPLGGDTDSEKNIPKTPSSGVNSNKNSSFILSLASLLALVILTCFISVSGPKIDTINAGDIWTGVCLTFSFLSFLNVCFIEILDRKNSTGSNRDGQDDGQVEWSTIALNNRRRSTVHFEKDTEMVSIEKKNEVKVEPEPVKKTVVNQLDIQDNDTDNFGVESIKRFIVTNQVRSAVLLGQFLHPIMFILFNIIYWTCLSRGAVVASS